MGRVLSCVLVLALAACASPSPRFMGRPATEVAQGPYRFVLYSTGTEVQGIRVDFGRPASRTGFEAEFVAAVERGLGCLADPSSIRGDLVVLTADVQCF